MKTPHPTPEEYRSELVYKLTQQDWAGAQHLLDSGFSIDSQTPRQPAALLWFARKKDLRVVEWLLERGADATIAGRHGETALTVALDQGQLEMVRLLLKTPGADRLRDTKKTPYLSKLAQKGCLELVEALLQAGCPVDAITETTGETALLGAAKKGRHEMIPLLLKWGANINHSNREGQTALQITMQSGDRTHSLFLIKNGANLPEDCEIGGDGFDRQSRFRKEIILAWKEEEQKRLHLLAESVMGESAPQRPRL